MSSRSRGMDRMFKSPIEEKFYFAARDRIPDLSPQYTASTSSRDYSLDFAKVITDRKTGKRVLKVAIELDGYEYHSSKEQRNHDSQRDRLLMAEGWHVIHFTGSQINKNVNRCVEEAAGLIELWAKDRGISAELGPRRRGGEVYSPEVPHKAGRSSNLMRIAVAAIAAMILMAVAAIAVASGWLGIRV